MASPGARGEKPAPLPWPDTTRDSSPAFAARAVKRLAYPSQTARPVERVLAGVECWMRLLQKAMMS